MIGKAAGIYFKTRSAARIEEDLMKKYMVALIILITLASGCSANDTLSSSIPLPNESETRINEQTTVKTTDSESSEGNPSTESQPISAEMPEVSSAITVSEAEQSTDREDHALNIEITVNGRAFSAELCDNDTAKAFRERLPLTLDMSELNGNEKYCYLSESLPTNSSRPSGIHTGDIMLYGSDCLVIFYESFSTSYSYTPIGKINDPDGLAEILGSGSVQVTFD